MKLLLTIFPWHNFSTGHWAWWPHKHHYIILFYSPPATLVAKALGMVTPYTILPWPQNQPGIGLCDPVKQNYDIPVLFYVSLSTLAALCIGLGEPKTILPWRQKQPGHWPWWPQKTILPQPQQQPEHWAWWPHKISCPRPLKPPGALGLLNPKKFSRPRPH
jgi:hypothetical protein